MKIRVKGWRPGSGEITISPHGKAHNRAAIIDAVNVITVTLGSGWNKDAETNMGSFNSRHPAAVRRIAQALLLAADMMEAYTEYGTLGDACQAIPFEVEAVDAPEPAPPAGSNPKTSI